MDAGRIIGNSRSQSVSKSHEQVMQPSQPLTEVPRHVLSSISESELATRLASRNMKPLFFRDARINSLDSVYAKAFERFSSRPDFNPPSIVVSCHRADSMEGHKGWGDLAFGRKISEAMLRRFPGCQVTLVGGAKIEPRQKEIAQTILGVDGVTAIFIDENQKDKESGALARAAAQKADVHIVGPSEMVEDLIDHIDQSSVRITEYASNTCMNNQLPEPPVKTGLFGAGVFVESPPQVSRTPESAMIRHYIGETIPYCGFELPANGLYFTYNSHDPAGTILALAAMHNSVAGDIKLVCRLGPQGKELFAQGQDDGLLHNLNSKGINKVVVVSQNQKRVYATGSDLPGAKTLYLLDPFPLSDRDIHLLVAGSGPLTGTSGDVSFSEVLASGKLPIPHETQKSDIKHDLLALTKALLGDDHPTVKYVQKASAWHSLPAWQLRQVYEADPDTDMASSDSGLAALINDPNKRAKIAEGIGTLLGVINSHYSLEHYLHGQVCKTLLHKKFPELAGYHQDLVMDKSLTQEERKVKLQQYCTEMMGPA